MSGHLARNGLLKAILSAMKKLGQLGFVAASGAPAVCPHRGYREEMQSSTYLK